MNQTPLTLDAAGVVPGTDSLQSIPPANGTPTPFVRGVDYDIDEDAGTVQRLAGSAIPSGVAIRARYVVPPVTRSSLEAISPPENPRGRPVNILSTARPAVAIVRQVVPIFDWRGPGVRPGELKSERRGNGLRIYLERPWFSSGEGELLGVVLAQGASPATTLTDRVLKHVTLWGRDPIFKSSATRGALPASVAAFPLAVKTQVNLTLDELGAGVLVDVAGHDVQYDAGRKLWFCDVQVDLGTSYNPFIRMALARYQPDSIANAFVSRVTLTDVFPLSPTRTATVTFDPLRAERLSLVVSGITYQVDPTPTQHTAAVVQVQVEERIPGMPGNLGWREVGAPVNLAVDAVVAGVTTWLADVTLPEERGAKPYRLVIREFEQYRNTAGFSDARVVYLDTIEL